MCGCRWIFCHQSLLAILRRKIGEPKEEIGNLNGFEFMYLSDLNSLSAKSVLVGEKLVATYSIST
jgi:hypothetical protein